MAFARAGWCLSSYYKFMAVGEANADQPRVRDEEGKSIQNREEMSERISREERVKCSGVKPIIGKIVFVRSVRSAGNKL